MRRPVPVDNHGVRVLVVDDDPTVRRATARVLERAGFHVLVADDGGAALALAESSPPDLAVVDYEMPTPGLEVVRSLKALYGAAVWVAVLSGHNDDDMRASCFSAGADDVLEKPVMPLDLRRRVEAAARSQQAYVQSRLARERADRLLAYGAEAAAMLAHDLNNGLAVAVSNIEFVTTGDLALPEDEAQALRSTLGALRRMSGLVANFVDIARFEDAAVQPHIGEVEVEHLLRDVVEVHAAAIGRTLQWEVTCEPPELIGRFDAALVERILHNLVGNAARYCKPGGVIALRARPAAAADGVELVVFNSGPAIPTEVADNLFSKYARGKQGGRRGLGLYFCRLACEAHGGAIEHRATPDGPSFVIHLPDRAVS